MKNSRNNSFMVCADLVAPPAAVAPECAPHALHVACNLSISAGFCVARTHVATRLCVCDAVHDYCRGANELFSARPLSNPDILLANVAIALIRVWQSRAASASTGELLYPHSGHRGHFAEAARVGRAGRLGGRGG